MTAWLLVALLGAPEADLTPAPEAAAPAEATTPVVSPAVATSPTLRVLVPDLVAPELTPRQLALWHHSLRAEVDKLAGLTTFGVSEIGPTAHATEQCPTAETSCLLRLAETLGVDEVLLAQTTVLSDKLGDKKILTLKRVRIRDAEVTGAVTRQMVGGHGEELLLILGDAIAELFSEFPLRPGESRGVDPRVADDWTRPPLPGWIFGTTAGATVATLATGIAFGVLARRSAKNYRDYAAMGVDNPDGISGAKLGLFAEQADRRTRSANIAYAAAGGLAVASGVLAYFTDWQGEPEGDLTVSAGAGPAGLELHGRF